MPLYEYQCHDCGNRFERTAKPAKREEQPCPSCGKKARIRMNGDFSYSFNQTVGGMEPPNTGVSAYDHMVDRVIGKDAEQRWKSIEEREAHKREVLRDNPSATATDLSVSEEGTYEVSQYGKRAVGLGNAIAKLAANSTSMSRHRKRGRRKLR
jgi:putative FmdB family regulatory protein